MSILAAAGPQQPQDGSALALWITALAATAAVSVAAIMRLLRPSSLARTPAVPDDAPLAPLVGVMFAGVVFWLAVPQLYARMDLVKPGRLSTREMVVLNTTVPMFAFVVLMTADAIVRPFVRQRLGFGGRKLLIGVLFGLTGIVLTLPVVSFTMRLTTMVYHRFDFYPREHELLTVMEQTREPVVKVLAIIAAVLVAPLWEELLFRGHVQTLMREGMSRLRAPARRGFPLVGAELEAPATPLDPPAEPREGRPVESWAAILMTSAIFAAIHPLWMFPPIFVLSVCLGFAYERTGNLWAPVTMHAAFNALMTVYFLQQSG